MRFREALVTMLKNEPLAHQLEPQRDEMLDALAEVIGSDVRKLALWQKDPHNWVGLTVYDIAALEWRIRCLQALHQVVREMGRQVS